jgi:predicted RNA-binding protein YlxR (DUF448 family)
MTRKKGGHRPQRTCLGCGLKEEQSRLIRVIVANDGELKIDRHGGRGGYLHSARDCWKQFLKKRSHYRAFHADVGRGAKEKLINELNERYWE